MNKGHSKNISHVSVNKNLMIGNVTKDKNERIISVSGSVKVIAFKSSRIWRFCLELYYIYACERDKDCEIGKYSKNSEFIKSLLDELVVTSN